MSPGGSGNFGGKVPWGERKTALLSLKRMRALTGKRPGEVCEAACLFVARTSVLVLWVAEERVEGRCSVSPLLLLPCVFFFTRSAQAAFAHLCHVRYVFRCLGQEHGFGAAGFGTCDGVKSALESDPVWIHM